MTKLIKNIPLYSKLLKSVGQQGRGIKQKQSLSPVECGELIKRLMEEENEDKTQVAERLDLGRPKDGTDIYKERDLTQLRNFLTLLTVSEKSRDFAGWGWEGRPKIAFSTVCELASLTHDEQDKVLQTAYKNDTKKSEIKKKDATKIRRCRHENQDLSIEQCIKKILKLKPVTVVTHLVVCETYEKLKNFIKSNDNYKEKILEILRNNLEGKFHELDATDILITISMDETAYKTFHEQQYKKDVPFTEFLNTFLEDKIA